MTPKVIFWFSRRTDQTGPRSTCDSTVQAIVKAVSRALEIPATIHIDQGNPGDYVDLSVEVPTDDTLERFLDALSAGGLTSIDYDSIDSADGGAIKDKDLSARLESYGVTVW